jgi:hypothetical protein
MVATTVFVVAAVGLAPLLLLAGRTTAAARTTTIAATLAREQIERLRGEPAVAPGTGCEFLDGHGRLLGAGATPPAGTAFVRRWSLDPLEADPDSAVVIQVVVTPYREGLAAAPDHRRPPGEARLVSVRARRAS